MVFCRTSTILRVAVLISLTTCLSSLATVEIKDLLNSLDEQLRNAEH